MAAPDTLPRPRCRKRREESSRQAGEDSGGRKGRVAQKQKRREGARRAARPRPSQAVALGKDKPHVEARGDGVHLCPSATGAPPPPTPPRADGGKSMSVVRDARVV